MLTFKSVGEYTLVFDSYLNQASNYDDVKRALCVIENIKNNILETYGIDLSIRTYDISETPENLLRTHYQCIHDKLVTLKENMFRGKFFTHWYDKPFVCSSIAKY